MNSVGKDGDEKRLGEITRVHVYVKRVASCEDKLATQKAASSGIADRVYIIASPICVRIMHDSVLRVNRGHQESRLNPC